MYIVVHIWGGLVQSVTPHTCLPDAQQGLAQAIPDPCGCDGDCHSYQEASIYQAEYMGKEGESIESRHSPSK